ncbi:hypothetical protein WB91_06985 [bacteria symbiont BFo1 of Frankliniella occidentalis]|nr:hypothetical protein WB91_06985 [bacteria symbiont BFo1 of Frankliniella occidentalis]
MPSGTIALTNNSTTVGGTGTAFTTELKAGDFIGVTVGGAPYTMIVASIASNTQLTGTFKQACLMQRQEGQCLTVLSALAVFHLMLAMQQYYPQVHAQFSDILEVIPILITQQDRAPA